MKESIDVFDVHYRFVSHASRGYIHKYGLWHQTFHCWLLRRNTKSVLVQKRAALKSSYPNLLDITAAGHLSAGETPADGIREIKEELGIDVTFNQLHSLGIRVSCSDGGEENNEFCHVFFLESNLPLDKYRLQADEVAALIEIPIQDGLDIFSGKIDKLNCNCINEGIQASCIVTRDDFIKRLDQYYLKVFIMAERYFEGKLPIAI